MWKQRNMKIGGDWHHMLGVFFCFPTGRWEVSGKLAKKVWAYIENLHVYLLFQICNGKKIVNIYWNHYFLKGRKNLLGQKPVLNEKKFLQVFNHLSTETWDYLQWSEVQQCGEKNQSWGRSGALKLATVQCSEQKTPEKVKRASPN